MTSNGYCRTTRIWAVQAGTRNARTGRATNALHRSLPRAMWSHRDFARLSQHPALAGQLVAWESLGSLSRFVGTPIECTVTVIP
jgi:hypothetical protein